MFLSVPWCQVIEIKNPHVKTSLPVIQNSQLTYFIVA
jgi:hypothetical protein